VVREVTFMKIERAVVLVTGASRGLGLALVREALKSGAAKVYAAARDPKQLEALVSGDPTRIIPIALDVTRADSLAGAAEAAPDVSLLVNNAGVLASYDVLTSDDQDIARDFAVNAFGMLAATKTFLPALERAAAHGPAAVVNVLSVVSLANMPSLGSYSSSKAAAFSITQALRSRLAKKRIAVHAALPGAIDTDMVRSFDMPKTSAAAVARGILDGVGRGDDDILPDPMSRDLFALWQRDHKELERRLAAMSG
jgi:NAD(P)-dependent dehydrogenase (short-subunit alcohol dehydrogenase family)